LIFEGKAEIMRAIHMTAVFWRAFLVVGLVLGAFVYGCGRTSLDDGFGPGDPGGTAGATGTAGAIGTGGTTGTAGTTGTGGRAGIGGQGGVGPGTIVACGTSACVAGMQSCCNHLDSTGRAVQACIDNSAPGGCGDGVVLCSADILCPRATPSCCVIQALGVGYCQAAGVPCMPPRP
jgi:hypothetical protein